MRRRTLLGIARGWLVGPPSAFAIALVASLLVRAGGGTVAH